MKTINSLAVLVVLISGFLTPLQAGIDKPASSVNHQVAYDYAGPNAQQLHLFEGSDYRFINPTRYVVFGDPVEFRYEGLTPSASYSVRLRFSTDARRTMRIVAGDVVIANSVTVEEGKANEQVFTIPPAAYQKGQMSLAIQKLKGLNAVVSEVEILSDNPALLAAIPEPPIELPILSPRPAAVADCKITSVDLGGIWKFSPAPPAGFETRIAAGPNWPDIRVPGEWAMQGFEVKPGTSAGYWRTFTVPAEWSGKRIKLRCDAVYSDATVWVNGKQIGKHSGGFTPFELDLTASVNPGRENSIAISALNESVADKLASGSQYACHQLGGIPRHLQIFVLPDSHLASLGVTTSFDHSFRDAILKIELEAAQEGARTPAALDAVLLLNSPDGKPVPLSPDRFTLASLKGSVAIPVVKPVKWDNEHPSLYTLVIQLEADGKTLETVTKKIGFRQVETRGNELFVNGVPVKLHGINRHEVYPTTGRSLPDGMHRRDIELFREANVNHIRTSHYPPDEALMDAADELGMFIECEAPFCWAPGHGQHELVCRQTAEMVLTYRNHPSVLFWSLANESKWGRHFVASSKLVRQLDPTRPQIFNDCGSKSDPEYTQILNTHYSGHRGPEAVRKGLPQPYYHGEDCHLNAYNRLELATDPALRDTWGRYLREMSDDMYGTKGSLGQSIWAGIDDTFYMKDDQTVGYGTWGPIDGWRRTKPEWWNMKKAYSPLRVLNSDKIAVNNKTFEISVENRQNFSDLCEMNIAWKVGNQSGLTRARVAAHSSGVLAVKLTHDPKPGDTLELTFSDPRGFVADQFNLPIGGYVAAPPAPVFSSEASLTESPDLFTIKSDSACWKIDRKTGQFTTAGTLSVGGPQLMILPLNNTGETQMSGKTKVWTAFTNSCAGWACSKVTGHQENGSVTITVMGKNDDAEGAYTLVFRGGAVEVSYEFTVTKAIDPRQIGLVFSLPRDCETFSWKRRGSWNVYPPDHIARLAGSVKASEGFEATSVGPRTEPKHPWRLDNLPFGNNDFCSTKHNIVTATLTDSKGRGILIEGHDGKQHVRCWRTDRNVNVLIADYSNGGSERFLRGLAKRDDRLLKPGDKIAGTARLTITF